MEYLEFEKPIEKLISKLEKAKELNDEGIDANNIIKELEEKDKKSKKKYLKISLLGKKFKSLDILIGLIH